jgi:hypothetical protein
LIVFTNKNAVQVRAFLAGPGGSFDNFHRRVIAAHRIDDDSVHWHCVSFDKWQNDVAVISF